MNQMSTLQLIWTAIFLAIWLGLAAVHLLSLRWGAILGITAGRHAILRKSRPGRFWVTWFLLALPFVVLPAFVLLGLLMAGDVQ